MTDTIELLEAIGRDASLRHASAAELTSMLEQAHASEALTAAVACGDSARLSEELGHRPMHLPQITQGPGHEEDESDDGDNEEPHHPPAPDQGKSSSQL
ncbi:hypothetical protein ACFFJT_18525 [Dyella flava]|uniref:Uncharacterized protein n=2 Tax=Dyella flava TaxID=1920170 RepID=A0ABS2K830_9GAMM|nr:hypothetical protein [Dyella flava]MBM7127316.1 hypothetical protein [Dyella flava]